MKILRTLITWIMLAFVAVGPAFVLGGCENDSGIEEAAEETQEAAEEAGDAVEDAADEAEDEI